MTMALAARTSSQRRSEPAGGLPRRRQRITGEPSDDPSRARPTGGSCGRDHIQATGDQVLQRRISSALELSSQPPFRRRAKFLSPISLGHNWGKPPSGTALNDIEVRRTAPDCPSRPANSPKPQVRRPRPLAARGSGVRVPLAPQLIKPPGSAMFPQVRGGFLLRPAIFDDRLKISSGSIQNLTVEDFWRIDLAVRSGK